MSEVNPWLVLYGLSHVSNKKCSTKNIVVQLDTIKFKGAKEHEIILTYDFIQFQIVYCISIVYYIDNIIIKKFWKALLGALSILTGKAPYKCFYALFCTVPKCPTN